MLPLATLPLTERTLPTAIEHCLTAFPGGDVQCFKLYVRLEAITNIKCHQVNRSHSCVLWLQKSTSTRLLSLLILVIDPGVDGMIVFRCAFRKWVGDMDWNDVAQSRDR
jgi:hypothetical protein